jgi:uncharacterized membrane protein YfcA
MDICASLYLGRKSSNEADKKELLWLFPFSLVGMVIGITLLLNAPSEPLLIVLGIFAGANGLRVLTKKKVELRTPISKWWAMPFGFFGGIVALISVFAGKMIASVAYILISFQIYIASAVSTFPMNNIIFHGIPTALLIFIYSALFYWSACYYILEQNNA